MSAKRWFGFLALAALTAGGVAGYFYVYPKLSESPAEIIFAALLRPVEAQSIRQEMSLELKVADINNPERHLELKLVNKGEFAHQADGTRRVFSETAITENSISADQDLMAAAALVSLIDATQLKFENILIGDDFYYRISGLRTLKPALELLGGLNNLDLEIYLALIDGRWIKADDDFRNQMISEFSGGALGKITTENNPPSLNAKLKEFQERSLAALKNIGAELISEGQRINQETIRGVKTDYYQFSFDGLRAWQYLVATAQNLEREFPEMTGYAATLNDDPAKRQIIETINKTKIRIWIDRTSGRPYQIFLPIIFDWEALNFEFTWRLQLRDYEAPIEIEAPRQSISFSHLRQLVMDDLLSSLIISGGEERDEKNRGDRDQDGLSDRFEALYGTNPENKDSDDDGFDDLTELKNGYDPLGPGKLAF